MGFSYWFWTMGEILATVMGMCTCFLSKLRYQLCQRVAKWQKKIHIKRQTIFTFANGYFLPFWNFAIIGEMASALVWRCPFVFQDDLWSVSVCEPATKKMSDKVGSSSAPLRLRKFYLRVNRVIFNLKLMKSQICNI